MKKVISIIISGMMILSQFAIFPVTTVNVVTRDSENVYEIATAQDLVDFATLVNNGEPKANAILTADINMNGINFDPIGTYSDYSGVRGYGDVTVYRGTFDGNGHIINNLTVTTNEKIETGLFGRGSGATVKNLGIKNAKISNTAGVRAGILAGELYYCSVSNVYTTGKVITTEDKQKGGIAGESAGSTLTDCFSDFSPYTSGSDDVAVKSAINCGVCSELFAFEGFGSEERPFLISNKNDLTKLSNLINASDTHDAYRKRYYKQTTDIDLNNIEFSPIGTYSNTLNIYRSFNGVYDGGNNSITNLYISQCEAQGGLFALACDATIKNISVFGEIDTHGEDDYGGVIGNINNSTVINCAFNGTVSGGGCVGGIIGRIWRSGTVESCYFNGDLIAKSINSERHSIGGIAGAMTAGYQEQVQNITIKNCYAVGNMTASTPYMIGGIAGSADKSNNDSNFITANNLYLFSNVNSDSNETLTNCKVVTSSELKDSSTTLGTSYVKNPSPSYNDGYPIFKWQLGDAESSIPVSIPFDGKGNKIDPYKICTAKDILMLSDVINDKDTGDYFRRCYYIQTDDIDLNNSYFTPIGINSDFLGQYNGNYHKITNLKISTSKNATGLFSSISGWGSVCRLSVDGNVTSSGSSVGGIIGTLSDGASMTECDYHGSVKGETEVGALVGLIENGTKIEACYSDADVTGQSSTGGLFGSVKSSITGNKLNKMYFAGTVSGGNTEQGAIIGTSEDAKIELSNIYFLSNICGGNAVNSKSVIGCTKLSTTALKACSDMLNSPFISNSSSLYGGYPIFEWQSMPYQFRGSGTKDNPYKISTKTDLEKMRDLINSNYYNQIYGKAYYIQMAVIDLEDELWIPIASYNSGQKFSGSYDGACHYIKGLNVSSFDESTGLFGVADSATIHDVVVYGVINGSSKDSGGIIGIAQNGTVLKQCGFVGSVSSENNAGGLIGRIADSCTITDCYHNENVNSNENSGGIAGSITFDNEVENAVVSIQNCYQANGIVSGNNSGCIVGNYTSKNNTSNTVSILNCFATTDADAVTNLFGATKDNTLLVTKSMLKGASEDLGTFFMNNTTTLNNGYPVFKWQIKSNIEGDVNNDGVFNISDVIMLQKWLLCDGSLTTWENGDLYNDNRIDAFDLCLMKQKIIHK